jgi:PAS domain S-box-containing protein
MARPRGIDSVRGHLRPLTASLKRLALAPAVAWSLSWLAVVAGGLVLDPARGPLETVAACALGALFGGLTWVGALGFAGRRAPLWIVPAVLALGLARGAVFVAMGEGAAGVASLLFEPWTLLAAAWVAWRAELLWDDLVRRTWLTASLAALASLEVVDGLVPLGLLPADTTFAWLVGGLVAAAAELGALKAWSARRELQLERAELGRQQLEAEVARERRTNALLQRREAWLFDFFETAPDLLLVLAPDDHAIVRCNRRFSEALGHARRDLVGRPLTELLEPETVASVRSLLGGGRRRLRNVELHLRRRDGGELVALGNLVRRSEADGHEEIRAVLHDVTRLQRGPNAAERVRRVLAQELGSGVFHADDEGRCAWVNASFCEITGIPPGEASRRSWLDSVHPEDRAWVEPLWRAAVGGRTVFRAEHRVQPPTGLAIHVVTECTPVSDRGLGGFAGAMTRLPASARPSVAPGRLGPSGGHGGNGPGPRSRA